MSELKTCPFCGGEARFETYGDAYCAVVCQSCNCGTNTMSFDDSMRAVAAWNRRAERTCEMLPSDTETTCTVHYRVNGCSVDYEYGYKRCSCCDADIVDCETLRFCPYCGARIERGGE